MRPIWRPGISHPTKSAPPTTAISWGPRVCGPRSPIANGIAAVLGARPPSEAPGHRISRRQFSINHLVAPRPVFEKPLGLLLAAVVAIAAAGGVGALIRR